MRVTGRLPRRLGVLVRTLSSVRVAELATVRTPVAPKVPAPLIVVVPPFRFAAPLQPVAPPGLTPVMPSVEAELLGE